MTNWREEFDKEFSSFQLEEHTPDEVKNFISQTLKEAFDEVEKGLPKESNKENVDVFYKVWREGYNQCLAEVKNSLKNIKEKYLK